MSFVTNKYRVLVKPRITEKGALVGSTENSLVFDVDPAASKTDIKRAVEELFSVKVKSVRTSNFMGKVKRVGQRMGRRKAWKKAYVSLSEGSSLDIIEGL
jgi:large subunit ribosomal protein L23